MMIDNPEAFLKAQNLNIERIVNDVLDEKVVPRLGSLEEKVDQIVEILTQAEIPTPKVLRKPASRKSANG